MGLYDAGVESAALLVAFFGPLLLVLWRYARPRRVRSRVPGGSLVMLRPRPSAAARPHRALGASRRATRATRPPERRSSPTPPST